MKSKLTTLLLSVAIALIAWFYVVTVVSPNSDKSIRNIKVEVVGEKTLNANGLMITNIDELSSVSLHLEGNRIDLNKLSSDNINISLDVSKISEPVDQDLPYTITFPGDVASNAFVVLNKNPGSIRVSVERRITKDVPVEVRWGSNVKEPYVADKDNVTLSQGTVNITGPESVLNQIQVAWIDVDLADRTESMNEVFACILGTKEGKPVDAKSVTVNGSSEIAVTMTVGQVKTVHFGVKLIAGGGATTADCEFVPAETIQVFGSVDALNAFEEKLVDGKYILGEIDLGKITESNNAETFPINLPEGVTFWDQEPITDVRVNVTFPDMSEKTLTVKNFQIVGVPAGLTAQIITEELKDVTLRGPKEIMATLTEENVVAEVDFTGANESTKLREVVFKCGDTVLGVVLANPNGQLHDEVTVHLTQETIAPPAEGASLPTNP